MRRCPRGGGLNSPPKICSGSVMTVWEGVVFELAPLSLHPVQFRAVGRERRNHQALFFPTLAVLTHAGTGVHARLVHQEHRGPHREQTPQGLKTRWTASGLD